MCESGGDPASFAPAAGQWCSPVLGCWGNSSSGSSPDKRVFPSAQLDFISTRLALTVRCRVSQTRSFSVLKPMGKGDRSLQMRMENEQPTSILVQPNFVLNSCESMYLKLPIIPSAGPDGPEYLMHPCKHLTFLLCCMTYSVYSRLIVHRFKVFVQHGLILSPFSLVYLEEKYSCIILKSREEKIWTLPLTHSRST